MMPTDYAGSRWIAPVTNLNWPGGGFFASIPTIDSWLRPWKRSGTGSCGH